jgi:hypothetical protein
MIDDATIDPALDAIRASPDGTLRGEVLSIRADLAEDVARLEAAPQVIYDRATNPVEDLRPGELRTYPVGRQEDHLSLEQRQSELAYVDKLLASDDLKFTP